MTEVNHIAVTISSGGTTSTVADLSGKALVGMHLPAALTGTAVTFTVDNGSGTYNTLADGAGADVSKTVAASKFINLAPSDFAGVNKLKVVSGSSEGADRTITLVVRDLA